MDLPPEHEPADAPPPLPIARPVAAELIEPPTLRYARTVAPLGKLLVPIRKAIAAFDVSLIVGAVLMSMIVPSIILLIIDPSETLVRSAEINLAVTAAFGVAIAMLAVVVHRARGLSMESLGASTDGFRLDVCIGLVAFVACLASRMMIWIGMALLGEEYLESTYETGRRIQEAIPKLSLYQAFAFATLVGTYEEVVFRGFVLPRMRRLVGSWTGAVLLTSIIFALLHMYQGPMGMVMVLMLSIVLGIVFVWRQSLLPVVVAHAVNNFVALFVLSRLGDLSLPADEGVTP